MPHIKIINLSKSFGDFQALRDVNLEIQDREYVSIIGPSGCGKTTLIKCIAGIVSPSAGEIYVDGKPITDLPIESRNVGYVFQDIALFPHLDVRSNISYGPRVKATEEESAKQLVKELIDLVELSDRANSRASELSGGAQQKVAIARALGSGSTLLLLDEPFGALDAKVRAELRYEIRRMIKDLKLTALHVTHDQEEAMSVADRVVIMKAGRIVEVGNPLQLYDRPKEIFTANFVGEANFFNGRVEEKNPSGSTIAVDQIKLETSEASFDRGQPVVVAIRPEFVLIGKTPSTADNILRGKVESAVFMGSMVRYSIRVTKSILAVAKHPLCYGELDLDPGDDAFLYIPPDRVLLYPPPSEGLVKEIQLE